MKRKLGVLAILQIGLLAVNAPAQAADLLWQNVNTGEWATWNTASCTSPHVTGSTVVWNNQTNAPMNVRGEYAFIQSGISATFAPYELGGEMGPNLGPLFAQCCTNLHQNAISSNWWIGPNYGTVVNPFWLPYNSAWFPFGQAFSSQSLGGGMGTVNGVFFVIHPSNKIAEYWASSTWNVLYSNIVLPAWPDGFTSSAPGGNGGTIFTSDFDGDLVSDVLVWDPVSGQIQIFLLNNDTTVRSTQTISGLPASTEWSIYVVGDLNCDARADILWWNRTTGTVGGWLLDGAGNVTGGFGLDWLCDAGCQGAGWWLADLITPGFTTH
jgi:FG-GAP-like repeat